MGSSAAATVRLRRSRSCCATRSRTRSCSRTRRRRPFARRCCTPCRNVSSARSRSAGGRTRLRAGSRSAGLDVDLVDDDEAVDALERSSVFLIGADTVFHDEAPVANKVSTRPLAGRRAVRHPHGRRVRGDQARADRSARPHRRRELRHHAVAVRRRGRHRGRLVSERGREVAGRPNAVPLGGLRAAELTVRSVSSNGSTTTAPSQRVVSRPVVVQRSTKSAMIASAQPPMPNRYPMCGKITVRLSGKCRFRSERFVTGSCGSAPPTRASTGTELDARGASTASAARRASGWRRSPSGTRRSSRSCSCRSRCPRVSSH